MYDSEPINYTLDLLDSTEGLIHTPLGLARNHQGVFYV